jgi:xylose dehydrogenase (NAD/NADP)
MLKWGLLSTARINRLLIPAIRSSARSQLKAVASRSEIRGAEYAAEWQIPRVTSYQGLLTDPDIDIIYVPLPNSLHAEWTIRAMEAGKHVLCEKPIALTTGDVNALDVAARRHRRIVTEGFMYRHHAQTERVLQLIGSGAIGIVRAIGSAFTFPQTRNPDVRLDPALGGGSLWDVGCYSVSVAQLLADARPVGASGVQQRGPTGVDESFAGTIEYENGVVSQFHCGFRAVYQTFLRVVGTDGVLDVERPFRPERRERLVLRRSTGIEEVIVDGSAIFVDEVADMEDAVLGLKPPRLSLAESWLHVATIEALYEAARSGLRVPVPTR